MRILGARIFSKFFGGKIKNFNEGSREKIKGSKEVEIKKMFCQLKVHLAGIICQLSVWRLRSNHYLLDRI